MQIYISKNNQQLGPFDESKVREMLGSGELSPNDLGIRHGEQQWQKLAEMFPSSPSPQVLPPNKPGSKEKNRRKLLLGCSGFFLVLLLIGGVLGFLGYRNMFPSDSAEDLPDKVGDFSLNNRYPPKGNIWGTETTFMGIYSDSAKTKTIIYMMKVFSNQSAAETEMRHEITTSCKYGETPMYFKFLKNGAEMSEGATCAVPLIVRKDNKLVLIGGGGADVESFIKFAENLPLNGGAEMKRK